MPEIDFTPESRRVDDTPQFERLKLKKDERARVVLLDRPVYAWVHNLRSPKLTDGVPLMVQRTRKGRTDETYTTYDFEFVGRPQCLGDPGIIEDKGLDATNCPACQRSTEGDQVAPPERRFSANVIRYGLRADGKLVQPFSCSAEVWQFTENVWNKLVDIAMEYQSSGGVLRRDLILGPCTSEMYQNFEVHAGAQNVWEMSEEIKARVLDTYSANALKNLEAACGRRTERRWMDNDLDKIATAWRAVNRYNQHGQPAPGDASTAATSTALAQGLDDLAGAGIDPLGAPTGDPLAVEAAPPASSTPAAAKPKVEEFNFDDLMSSL